MNPGISDRRLLVALNRALELPRPSLCALALHLHAWRDCKKKTRPRELARSLGVPDRHLALALSLRCDATAAADRELAAAARLGAEVVTLSDPSYPAPLRDLALPPPVLYLQGSLSGRPGIAVVGARRADPYGREVAGAFSRELAGRGLVIVSGFARGVDACAHQGALEAAGGETLAVLGCGLDVPYPRRHRSLARQVAVQGALLSEFPLGAAPLPRNFPIRNRIIAAMAEGTLVVQAAVRSGSLITARLALELGRDVYAVPGRIFDPLAIGPNTLIRDGALTALAPRDILESLSLEVQDALTSPPPPEEEAAAPVPGPGRSDPVRDTLRPAEPMTPEAVASATGLPVDAVLVRLLELELAGRVIRYPGPAYSRRA